MSSLIVKTERCGELMCEVDGDLAAAPVVILTVHDLGCNSSSWQSIVHHPSMKEITSRATWLHVNFPGQEDSAADLPAGAFGASHSPPDGSPFHFPTLDDLATGLADVLKGLNVKSPVVVLGEGAGANVAARLALHYPELLLGAVLIHCTSTTAGFMESLHDKLICWKLLGGMNPTAENYLVLHRFGDFSRAENQEQVEQIVIEFRAKLRSTINAHNLRSYIDSFLHRTSIAEVIGGVTLPLLIMTGEAASHNHTVHTLYNAALQNISNRKLIEFVEFGDGVANVIEEAPVKFAESFQYFMQGLGVIGGAHLPHVGVGDSGSPATRPRGLSMTELDQPRHKLVEKAVEATHM